MVNTVEMNTGRPVAAASDSMYSGVARGPVAIMKTPRPASPSVPTSARNSASSAIVEGIGSPAKPE